MPQMGESIAEGTIVRWIKKVGDAVDRDEPLFEISTDKVDAEIPSPAAGVLTEIKVREGETVRRQQRRRHDRRRRRRAGGRRAAPPRRAGVRRRRTQTAGPTASASTQPQGDGHLRPPRPETSATVRAPGHVKPNGQAPRSRRQGRPAASEVVAARPPHRARAQRRHRADSRLGHRRPRDQARHPRVSRPRSRRDRRREPGRRRRPRRPCRDGARPVEAAASASRSSRSR